MKLVGPRHKGQSLEEPFRRPQRVFVGGAEFVRANLDIVVSEVLGLEAVGEVI